ncbi:S1/P1 nuclease [Gemmatimonas groenlandica]|uniref:S1/P1 nuclease n=1 Tax=Gemmatimonas groenlandica TaxID=2732249 RepID=A0A6M4IVV0_9BACT|nr:S1/P1 nuclease [Gemmatimonas groenlandica]QJR37646.1 S1/P1 nuclease [Gemmatimonas groenlandica]
MKRSLLMLSAATAMALSATSLAAAPRAERPTTTRRWDAVGHRAMAAMAYDRLRPATRARVDDIMRAHPDIAALGANVNVNTPVGIREVFLRASVWPDQIRGDARFYPETDSSAQPTPLLPGYPTMARRAGWHYLSRSFSTDGTPTIPLVEPNVASVFPSLAESLGDNALSPSLRAYSLSWIIHVVGDLHQPLHGTSRSAADQPDGDAGGNRVWVQLRGFERDSINLHAVWDGWVGRPSRELPIDDVAAAIARELPMTAGQADDALNLPRGAPLAATVRAWADESATLARYMAYELPPRAGSVPPVLTDAYVALGTRIARQRLALSAYRLAAVIEAQLGS